MSSEVRNALQDLASALADAGELRMAGLASAALNAPEPELEEFVKSDDLWGGGGSIADQAAIENREKRRRIEAVLIGLGEAQIRAGIVNARTSGWVPAFREWQSKGI